VLQIPSKEKFNATVQSLFIRFFAVLLHGYRASTFFPGTAPQYVPLLSTDNFIDSKVTSLASAVSIFKVSCRCGDNGSFFHQRIVQTAASKRGLDVELGPASPEATRSFIQGLCESQSLARLQQRHTSIYLRPFHSLASVMGAATPTLQVPASRACRIPLYSVPPPSAGHAKVDASSRLSRLHHGGAAAGQRGPRAVAN
jgi:hypothetical protein